MTEAEQRRNDSPLLSDRGVTIIKDTVVSRIASMAAGEVDGVHMGGSASRSAGGFLEGITGSESSTRGVSVEVGTVEAAIDLKVGIDYGRNLLGTVGEVRQKIFERVQELTGLKVTELNVTIADIVFPEDGQGDRGQNGPGTQAGMETRTLPAGGQRQEVPERETTEVEPTTRTHTEGSSGPVPEEEVRVEETPVEEGETRGIRVGDGEPSATGTGDETRDGEETASSLETGGAPEAEAPTDETTLTGGPGGETTPKTKDTDDGTQEIDRGRASEAEERRAARRRRRRREQENG